VIVRTINTNGAQSRTNRCSRCRPCEGPTPKARPRQSAAPRLLATATWQLEGNQGASTCSCPGLPRQQVLLRPHCQQTPLEEVVAVVAVAVGTAETSGAKRKDSASCKHCVCMDKANGSRLLLQWGQNPRRMCAIMAKSTSIVYPERICDM
jgi:hypothetical protein